MEINLKALRSNEDWLRFFAQIGQEAYRLLNSKSPSSNPVDWSQLKDTFFAEAYPPVSSASHPDYERWLDGLKELAYLHKIQSPNVFTRIFASKFALDLLSRGTSPARRFRFYRRVWRTFGLNPQVWNAQEALVRGNSAEHYRRLTTAEVRRLVSFARKRDENLADMILIGYWTGLRLSDVAELERSEILLSRHALQIVPNKVRERKPRPLIIPLVGDAETIVRKRMSSADHNRLFPLSDQKHLSRRIGRIFKAARIKKIGSGRASFHSLRATFISLMDEAGIQPYITDAITGHSGGGMHARYTQPALPILRRAIVKALPRVSDAVSGTLIPRVRQG